MIYKRANMAVYTGKMKQLENGDFVDHLGNTYKATENLALIVPKKQKWTGGEFCLVMRDWSVKIANMKLNGETASIIFYLLGKTNYDNEIDITQSTIAEELSMDQSNVSKALKILVSKEIITTKKVGSKNAYKLNPDFAFRGKAKNYGKICDEFDEVKRVANGE